jgi:para-nitrobenzyl esterase
LIEGIDLTTVETPFGAFPAVADGDVVRIRNVRYARADRFERPVAVEPDPHEASARVSQRIACPQTPSASDALFGELLRGVDLDEDCLRLTITRPRDLGDEPLPVMVWVHGGSYVSGAGDLGGYDAAALAGEQRVVVVTVTYRLGVLGFLGDGSDARPANLGLLDLVEALRWVHACIGGFGGDPDLVTVFGHSSGADAIAHLLLTPDGEHVVRRAILQSAPFGIRGRRARLHERMHRAAGLLTADSALDEVFAAQERAKTSAARAGLRAGMPFSPHYGFPPLPAEADVEATWRRRAPGLDVLVCWTSEEASFFGELIPGLRALRDRPLVGRTAYRVLIRSMTDAVYRRHGRRFARLLAQAGARVQQAEFDGRPAGSRIGAAHAIDLPLLFPNVDVWAEAKLIAPDGARSLVEAGAPLRAAWAEFARTGRIAAMHVPLGAGWSGGLRVH